MASAVLGTHDPMALVHSLSLSPSPQFPRPFSQADLSPLPSGPSPACRSSTISLPSKWPYFLPERNGTYYSEILQAPRLQPISPCLPADTVGPSPSASPGPLPVWLYRELDPSIQAFPLLCFPPSLPSAKNHSQRVSSGCPTVLKKVQTLTRGT